MTAKRKITNAESLAKTPAKPYEPMPHERAAVDVNFAKAREKPPAPWVKTETKNGVVHISNDHPKPSLGVKPPPESSRPARAKHGSRTNRNTENALMALNTKQQKQFNTVCARIAGGESLRTICEDKALPTARGVLKWLNADGNDAAVQQYARAREEQADFYADEIIGIADDERLDPNSRRIMIDARKWAASKLRPKVYGDKLALGGAAGLPAIKHAVQEDADAFTSALAGLVGRAGAGKATRH